MSTLNVDVHLQDDPDNCGEACAQMVVRFLTTNLLQQASFQSPALALNGWATTPDQLADMVNQHLTAGSPQYVVRKATTRGKAMGWVRDAIASGSPALALTHHGGHWVVVRGLTQVTTRTFIVHIWDPVPALTQTFPNLPAPAVPVHSTPDPCFGRNFETANGDEIALWADWKDQFLKVTNSPSNPWGNKFVVIAPATIGMTVSALKVDESAPSPGPAVPILQPIPQHQIFSLALNGLQGAGVLDLPNWSASLTGAASGADPLLVDRLDRQGAYYLVSLVGKGGGALVGVDAFSGEVRFARLNPARKSVARLFAPVVDLPEGLVVKRVVWTPSEASDFSPYLPFAEVRSLTGQTTYVRIDDGVRFDSVAVRFGQPSRSEPPTYEPPKKGQ